MKKFILLSLMLTTSAFANVCDFSYTSDIDLPILSVSNNHGAFSQIEKDMIVEAVKETMEESDPKEALRLFADYEGPNAGEISYMLDGDQKIAMVHFWPGDTEVGMIFSVSENGYKRLAVIGDSEIDCH
jgi:hypothetical protein